MSTPNWSKLVVQGRAKAHGVPWVEEELALVLEITKTRTDTDLRQAAEYVRRGAKKLEDVEALIDADAEFVKENGKASVDAMTRSELLDEAKEKKPHITNDAPDDVLRDSLKEDSEKEISTVKGRGRSAGTKNK